MRRQHFRRSAKTLRCHNPDSDESISDEDEVVSANNVLSLQPTNMQEFAELPLPVRLEFLKGISNHNLAGKGGSSSLSIEKPLEDEVEMPDFKEDDFGVISGEVVANSTDEEINSADEGNSVLSTGKLHKYGPQSIRNERVRDKARNSEAMSHFKGRASRSAPHATCSKANTFGVWSKAKPRFSLPSMSLKFNIDSLPETMKAVDPRDCINLDGNYLEDDGRLEIESDTEPAETESLACGFNLPSVADRFGNLQDKYDLLLQKNGRSHLQDRVVDSEDSPEPVDSGSSNDNEVSDQHMKITFPRQKMQTMVDQFDEALGTSSVIAEGTHVKALNSLRAGIFGKLQQVVQKEKERDVEFLKKLQAGGELGCVDVKIISRYRDGKLTVCHCSFGKCTKNFPLLDNSEGRGFGGCESGQSTVIFSPKVCNNVDLEVGNLIRIHPPWKEVQVGNDNIVLCTYFSEILSST